MEHLLSRWSSVGVGFDGPMIGVRDIDLERLLLDTARHASSMARVFIMAATWLHFYGDTIAKHRLKRLIEDELEPEYRPVLGLLLDAAQEGTHPREFASVVRTLAPASSAGPLFESARGEAGLSRIAERRASALSRRWGLWMQPFEFKEDAIRPASWVMGRHPGLRTRADFRGDLRASVLASLRHDARAGESELRLARSAGGSRSQVRNALANLAMTGRVSVRDAASGNRKEVVLVEAA